MNQHIYTDQEGRQTVYCDWHPDVETGLSCGKRGKGTCTRCLVHASVGIRCPECGKASKNPTFEVRPIAYAKAALVGAIVAIGGGALWGLVNLILINLGLV
ncbi:MAG: hypothetical protein VX895_05465, partial [Chloroflexota bacterium]|nr:hypothetical protein [Chloroflexota bacterium]